MSRPADKGAVFDGQDAAEGNAYGPHDVASDTIQYSIQHIGSDQLAGQAVEDVQLLASATLGSQEILLPRDIAQDQQSQVLIAIAELQNKLKS